MAEDSSASVELLKTSDNKQEQEYPTPCSRDDSEHSLNNDDTSTLTDKVSLKHSSLGKRICMEEYYK